MEKYEIRTILSIISLVSMILIFINVYLKYKSKSKEERKSLELLLLYTIIGSLSTFFYLLTVSISWLAPAKYSYEFQCFIYSWVWSLNSLLIIIIGEFIYSIFYQIGESGNKIFRYFYTISGIIMFFIFMLGGIFGFTHEPIPPPPVNNNDIKLEYYFMYNLVFLPVVLVGVINTRKVQLKLEKGNPHIPKLKRLELFFISNSVLFIFGVLDLVSSLFGYLTIIMIAINAYFAYLVFIKK